MTKKEIMVKAHKMVKELRKEYPSINYHFQLGLCMKYLVEEEKLNKEIDVNYFMDYYTKNPKLFNYLLQKESIFAKNGYETKSQEYESEITTSTYQILDYQEMEDIKQEGMTRIFEYFIKHKVLKYRYIGNLYKTCMFNAYKSYIRQKKYFRVNKNPEEGFQKMEMDCHFDKIDILGIDINNMELSDRQKTIVSLLNKGYNKVEVADIIDISRQAIYKNLKPIQKEFTKNGYGVGLQ